MILAAGAGSRLRRGQHCPPKPLTRLLGRTLIERSVRSCRAAGVEEFVVAVGYRSGELVPHLRSLERDLGVRVRVARSLQWQLGNGASALAAAPGVHDPFFLLMGDHLFAPEFLTRLLDADRDRLPCTLVVDRDIARVRDLREATKVRLDGDRIRAIGKELVEFDGVDTGVFLCRPPLFEALREAAATGHHTLADGVRALARRGDVAWASSGGLFWQDIDTPEDLAFARSRLSADRPARRELPTSVTVGPHATRRPAAGDAVRPPAGGATDLS